MRRDRFDPTKTRGAEYSPYSATAPPYSGVPRYAYADVGPPTRRSGRIAIRLIVFLAIVSVLLIVAQTVFFRLNTLYIIGNDTISADHIAALSGLVKGENIFSVSEDKVRRNLSKDHWIILNHMYKQYPGEVYLFVDERDVIATMQWLGIQYTLDIDGMVLDEYSEMNYPGKVPTVYGFSVTNATVGDYLSVRVKEQLIAFSSIVTELTIQRYEDQISNINVSDPEQLTLQTRNNITVQLGNSDYMRAKIGAMRTDIAYLQQLGETSGVLDVTTPEDGKFRRE